MFRASPGQVRATRKVPYSFFIMVQGVGFEPSVNGDVIRKSHFFMEKFWDKSG
jgi:hypothetical protein